MFVHANACYNYLLITKKQKNYDVSLKFQEKCTLTAYRNISVPHQILPILIAPI